MTTDTGVLLLQLGTPSAPTAPALRRYLREFLWDVRVVDVARPVWWAILNFMVLPVRPARSARLYRRIWTPEGSPLAVTSRRQAEGLEQAFLSRDGASPVRVAVGMRYGRPSIADAVDALIESGCERLVALPLYPQYASATTGSSLERLFSCLGRRRVVPPVRVVPPYFADPLYVEALASAVRSDLAGWRPDHLLVSFHGLPKRYATLGDPYPRQCVVTAEALRTALGWPRERMTVTFQSRFGSEEWLSPYTDETLRELGRRGGSLAVVCPGFTADCLETLEEIGITGREQYQSAGGGEYRLLGCLNSRPEWIQAMASMLARECHGWL
jgi:ferrochelatase